ncbi:hypothetical protein [Nocardioides houyundeii]|uniref:hypothetical protein n=1 Tax=Nocardioides houyundeii TaxID=2045452 RepID=UPI0019638F20|nr:hypothetical protein [Nocardioides houyundeii]
MSSDPLLQVADELYSLPLAEFTPARDRHAKELKGSDAALAARVKALRKPSLAAWVVNLLVRREAEQVEQLLAVGAALREAQANLVGEELRALTRQRRQVTAAVTGRARSLAAEAGQRVTDSVADHVEATLTAAVLDSDAAEAVRSGLLVTGLSATGVDPVDVAAAVAAPAALGFAASTREAPVASRPQLRVVPDPDADAKRLSAARERVSREAADLASARDEHDAAAREVAELEARSMQLQSEIEELRRRLAELEAAAEQVDDDLTDAEDVRAEAEGTLAERERSHQTAAESLATLEQRPQS